MKTTLKKFAGAMLLLAAVTVQAKPIALPATAGSNQTGTFTIQNDTIVLSGNPVSLTTTSATKGNIADGSASFMSGQLQYNDGASSLDGQMAKVSFGSQVEKGQVTYILKGLVYGKLTQDGQTVDVNGPFLISTKASAEGTPITQVQVDSANLVLTIRSNINNTQPAQ